MSLNEQISVMTLNCLPDWSYVIILYILVEIKTINKLKRG